MKNIITLSVSTLLLTSACTESNWMGDGFTWNDSTPISSPAKTSSWNNKTAQNTADKTLSAEAIIAGVSGDIVESLELSLIRTKPIYLAPMKELDSNTSIFDHNLRSKLISKGYTLSSTPSDSYTLGYDIKKSDQKDAVASAHDFIIVDINGEEETIIETRTQELPE